MKEPSVLDYLKSRLNPWQSEKVELAESETPPVVDASAPSDGGETPQAPKARISLDMTQEAFAGLLGIGVATLVTNRVHTTELLGHGSGFASEGIFHHSTGKARPLLLQEHHDVRAVLLHECGGDLE